MSVINRIFLNYQYAYMEIRKCNDPSIERLPGDEVQCAEDSVINEWL